MSRRNSLLKKHVAYSEQGKTSVVTAASGRQIQLKSVRSVNRSGSASDLGHLVKLSESDWAFGQIDDSATPDYVDQSTAIKANGTVDLFSTTNDDGFLVQADQPFNLVGFNVSQAQTGSPVYALSYWNGSAYVTLPTIAVADLTGTGSKLYVFLSPIDWVAGTSATVGGDGSKYSIRVVATTAPTQAVQVDELWLGAFLTFSEAITDNGSLELEFTDSLEAYKLESGQSLLPYFGVANAGNVVEVFYQSVE